MRRPRRMVRQRSVVRKRPAKLKIPSLRSASGYKPADGVFDRYLNGWRVRTKAIFGLGSPHHLASRRRDLPVRARFRLRWAENGRESRARILVIIIAAAIILSVNLGVAASASYCSLI